MSTLNGQGSGTNPIAATADWNLHFQSEGVVLIADGFGNVAGSGIQLSSITSPAALTLQDCGTF